MDQHDQALAWAQANPQDPRAQDIMAKAWAAKNPQDPRSAQIMARFQQQPQQASGGAAQAALEGYGQTATLGYLPQLQAAASQGIDKVTGALGVGPAGVDAQLRAQGFNVPEESYVDARDQNIARHEQQYEEHPGATLAGKAAGLAGSMLITPAAAGLKAARGAGLAKTALTAAGSGALQGAAYNPGDEKGVVHNPLEGDFQAGDRAKNAAIGAAIGAPMGAAGYGIGKLAEGGRMINRVKDSANLAPSVKGEIDGAIKAAKQNYIAPREAKLQQYLKGKNVEFSPQMIKEEFPNLYRKLVEKQAKAKNVPAYRMLSGTDKIDDVAMPASRAMKLRRGLDKAAEYKTRGPFDPTAQAKSQQIAQKAGVLREKLSDLGPEVGQIQGEVGKALNSLKSLQRTSKNRPIASITAKPGTDRGSLIDYVDEIAGSNLEKTAQGIKSASNNLIDPINFVKPLEAPNELRKLGLRGLQYGARAAEAVTPEATPEVILRSLFELKR